jgi:hypothetical protein
VIWAVYNSYLGNGAVCALVEAETEQHAFELAADAFAEDDKRPEFSAANPSWRAEKIQLPYVCELS